MNNLLFAVLLAFSVNAFADDDLVITVDKKEPIFVVSLPANPTTGYQWSVEQFDQTLFSLTSSNYLRPQSKLIGAGGTMRFTFTLKKGIVYPNQTKMTFKYARSWEPDSASVKNVTINFF
ncbi:protease inhibitor I42 family protein [Legionella waltersii]|uniref:Secreted protein n=1 Tax=Legionella waltersii TaxID=66969 RepID=A0A0W1AMB8_9GAMM|nr:protease inhibitor I42 family protein [Legionella waltersii]KTD82400.1 secreted protein [Legionella waltersii]SNV03522.1 secreted protein [Legionella waltersii]